MIYDTLSPKSEDYFYVAPSNYPHCSFLVKL